VSAARLKIDVLKWRIGRLVPRKYGPWKAQEPLAAVAQGPGDDAAAEDEAPPQVTFYVRHFALTPDRQVVEITDAVAGLDRDGVGRVSQAVEAGRFMLAPNGQVAGVWDEAG